MKTSISGEVTVVRYGCGRRHVIVALGFVGFACVYAQRWNFSLAIISMVNMTAVSELRESHFVTNTTTTVSQCRKASPSNTTRRRSTEGPYVWSEVEQGLALGAFFYGYILTQVLGGWMSSRLSAKWTVGISVLGSSVFTLLTPLAAQLGLAGVVVDRMLIGLFQGLIFPAYQQLLGRWTPPKEVTTATLTAHAGTTVGTVVAFSFVGLVAETKSLGWQSSFYIIGAVGCLWFALWTFLVYETPQRHPEISAAERNFILQKIDNEENCLTQTRPVVASTSAGQPIPWLAIATSVPVWAIFISHMTTNFGFYMMLTKLPSYLKSVLGLNMRSNGFISGIPYVARFVTMILGSRLIDYLRHKGHLSTVAVRKLADSMAKLVPAITLLVITFIGCSHWAALLLLAVSSLFQGFISIAANMLDLSPEYAGIIYGLSNTLATIPGMVAPYFVGVILNSFEDMMTAWRVTFFTAAAVYLVGLICYLLMASATKQPWSH